MPENPATGPIDEMIALLDEQGRVGEEARIATEEVVRLWDALHEAERPYLEVRRAYEAAGLRLRERNERLAVLTSQVMARNHLLARLPSFNAGSGG